MRIMGVDPGLTRCGLGVVELAIRVPNFVGVEVVRTSNLDQLPGRLQQLDYAFTALLDKYQPEVIAVERVFSQHNVRSAMDTASASAVVMLAAAKRGIPVAVYTPTEVKAAVSGNGRADKAQVTSMVTRILKLDEPPKPADAADALALAICHAWRGIGQMRVAKAIAAQRSALS
ncbi:MAG: crossover junction endodeoxyribonuclease RuvC [Actinobacteria bacterium]|nr:crossover junction endodeoxyribonuclease RuvC [Actinomycetota bacterium]